MYRKEQFSKAHLQSQQKQLEDLTKPKTVFKPSLNHLCVQKFFKTPRVFVPEPLIVQKNQRPVGPFSGV